MIAYAGALRLLAGQHDPMSQQVLPRWPLHALTRLETAEKD
jgi:tRNA A37 threonylcarbamoyltransferase TsaD